MCSVFVKTNTFTKHLFLVPAILFGAVGVNDVPVTQSPDSFFQNWTLKLISTRPPPPPLPRPNPPSPFVLLVFVTFVIVSLLC